MALRLRREARGPNAVTTRSLAGTQKSLHLSRHATAALQYS
nr:hypothetical protein [Mycobacterium uberis]